MYVSAIGDVANELIKTSPLIKKLKKKPSIQSMLVHINRRNELRIFIREELGRVQNVVWLSEQDAEAWVDSEHKSYLHFSKKRQRDESPKEACLSI